MGGGFRVVDGRSPFPFMFTVPVKIEKTVVVEGGNLKLRYLIENTSDSARTVSSSSFTLPSSLTRETKYSCPRVTLNRSTPVSAPLSADRERPSSPSAYDKEGREVFVNRVPGLDVAEQEFFYATELIESRCGVRSKAPRALFPCTSAVKT